MRARRGDWSWRLAALILAVASQGCVCLLNAEGTAGDGGGAARCRPGCFLLFGGAPVDGCGMMGGPGCGETLDSDLEGCFQHPDGVSAGRLRISQSSCNLVTGYGFGLEDLELGPAPHDAWTFSGEVLRGRLTDPSGGTSTGLAVLAVQGGPQDLIASRNLAADGSENLSLQRTGPAGEVRVVELERCTCPCGP